MNIKYGFQMDSTTIILIFILMDFEIYCDESGIEALTDINAHSYIAIGSIWMPSDYRVFFKEEVKKIKEKYSVHGELKWNKISPKYYSLYKEIIDYFFNSQQLRFRIILIDSQKVNHQRYNNLDPELGFYKFYYQLLHHWIYDFNNYNAFLDLKVNRDKNRLSNLGSTLNSSNRLANITVQGLPSDESLGIQLADILTGLVNAKFNDTITSQAKIDLINHIENTYLGKKIAPTYNSEKKLNIFKIQLEGGW